MNQTNSGFGRHDSTVKVVEVLLLLLLLLLLLSSLSSSSWFRVIGLVFNFNVCENSVRISSQLQQRPAMY